MKFFAVFAAIVAVAIARPSPSSSAVAFSSDLTLNELSDLLQHDLINPAAVPYLEGALNAIMDNIFAGGEMQSVHFVLPADVTLFAVPEIVSPVVVAPSPINPSPVVVGPIAPGSSALVQVIINVNNEPQVADVVAPLPVLPGLIPEQVQVVEVAENQIEPVDVVEVVTPEQVQVVEVAENQIEPVDVVEVVTPEAIPQPEFNPIDVIAVNPVDTWGPSGLAPAIDVEDVGPL